MGFDEGSCHPFVREKSREETLESYRFCFVGSGLFLLTFSFANREVQAIIAVFGTTLVTRATKSFTDRGWQGLMFWKGED